MSKNIYDIYRDVQTKRNECYDERSAAFIEQGKLSKDITHKRLDTVIKAAVVFSHKEGPDEVIVYSYIEDDLQKSDYFIYDNTNYLVYENIRLTDSDINYKKQKAVECNVAFSFESKSFIGYYKSSLRGTENPDFVGREIVTPDETPLLILPTNSDIEVNSEFVIEEKPFKVVEFDNITNKGITYYYLERNYNKVGEIIEPEVQPTYVGEEPEGEVQLFSEEPIEKALRPMVEYTFDTVDAYFAATPKVEVVSRKRTEVTFKVPFGISEVDITTKDLNGIVERNYKVVL